MVLLIASVFFVIHAILLVVLVSKVTNAVKTLNRIEILMQDQKDALGVMAYKSDEFV
jgi:hypothetical protein